MSKIKFNVDKGKRETKLEDYERRQYERYNYRSEMGRSSFLVDCPFCDVKGLRVYAWSLAGSGKKCPKCGAMFTSICVIKKKEGAK
jgi:hypothetical protein